MLKSKHALCWGLSRLIAGLSDQFLLFVIPILVYRKTESISLSGAAYIIEWIPRLVSPLLSGVLVDTFSSRKVAVVSDSIRAVLCLAAFGLFAFFPAAPFWIYAMVAGAIGLFYETAFLAFDVSLTRTARTEDLPAIQSGIQSAEQMALILGPGLAVALAAHFSLQAIFLVAAAMFLLASLTTSFTNEASATHAAGSIREAIASIRGGYRHIVAEPLLRNLTLICILQNIALGLCLALSPGYLQAHLGLEESAFGMLVMVGGVASLILFLTLPRILRRTGIWPLFSSAVLAAPAALALMGVSDHYVPYFAGFALLTVTDGCLSIVLRTTRATVVPPGKLGSVVSAMIFFLNAAFPLGGALVSGLIPALGGKAMLLSLALVWAVASALLLRVTESSFPSFDWGRA